MKKLLLIMSVAAGAWAQVPQVSSSTEFLQTRTAINNALTWLDINKQPVITPGTQDQVLNGTLGFTALAHCAAAGGVLWYSTSTHLFACHALLAGDIPALDYQPVIAGAPGTWPSFSAVATSGSYTDLSNKPAIPGMAYHAYTGTSAVDFSTYNAVLVTASGGDPTVTVSANPALAGTPVYVTLCNDTTARTWTLPANFVRIDAPVFPSTSGGCATINAHWDGTNYVGDGMDQTPSILALTAQRAAPTQAQCPAGGCLWPDASANNLHYFLPTGATFALFRVGVDANPDTGQVVKVNGGTPGATCTNQFVRSINSSAQGTCQSIATADIPTAQNTRTVTISDLAPVVGDSGLILVVNPATAIHLTRVYCAVQGATNVVVNLDKRTEATIGTDTGNHLLGADLTAIAGGANAATFADGAAQCGGTTSCAVAAHAPVVMTFTSVSSTPTALNCSVDYTVD